MSSDKRQEFIVFSNVLAVSMLVDHHRRGSGATPSTVEGASPVSFLPGSKPQ